MLLFDVTKSAKSSHRSGLTRVSARLLAELGSAAYPVSWDNDHGWRDSRSAPVTPASTDWLLTPELFSADERPGFSDFLSARPCRLAAIYHDAIPLKHPLITWPQSVARHPSYLKLLASFDRIFAVSEASRTELQAFWQWQGLTSTPPITVLPLGADSTPHPRLTAEPKTQNPKPKTLALLCLGILEPRKNQSFLLDVCADLWRDGLAFELHLVGRVNPHFGPPIVAKIKSLQREHRGRLHFHKAAPDATVAQLYATARATVFPTIAEGCGLPLLESLWMGIPCVHSDLPVLRENADAGGCLPVALNDRTAWRDALRRLLTDDAEHARLAAAARTRPLPTWSAAARVLLDSLK